ncbi:MAG: PolC-type DNA polymerase III [bacterium]
MTYLIDIDNAKTTAMLKGILKHEGLDEALANIFFKNIECSEALDGTPVSKILIRLEKTVPASLLLEFKKVIEADTCGKVKMALEFSEHINTKEMVFKYWELFVEDALDSKLWLENTIPRIEKNIIYIDFKDKLSFDSMTEPKVLAEVGDAVFKFFKINYGISTGVLLETDNIKREALSKEIILPGLNSAPKSAIMKDTPIEGETVFIENVTRKGKYVIEGRLFLPEEYLVEKTSKEKGNKFLILNLYITDEADTIKCHAYVKPDDPVIKAVKKMSHARVSIEADEDSYEGGEITGKIKQIHAVVKEEKIDTEIQKRIEFHAHTKMSAMDSVLGTEEYIKMAKKWGHKAVAITDHGVVHSFPLAFNAAQANEKTNEPGIKLILGMEGYLVESIKRTSKLKVEGDEEEIERDDERHEERFHIIILVKNKIGLKNLYKLVSMSHLDYFYKKPRIPRAELLKHREGLIIGGACNMGEIYQAILKNKSWEQLEEIVGFYDYLEIQPRENNKFLVRTGELPSMEEVLNINEKIYELGKQLGKPVLATGDVHFLRKTDRVYREILMSSYGFDDIGEGEAGTADLSFKTTNEMLEEFAYLGKERAYEVVVTNCEKINALIEEGIRPVPEKLQAPHLENSEKEITQFTWDKAKKMYGNTIHKLIEERIESELHLINDFGYSVLYLLAKKMVEQSKKDGYIVGSRGSVGSSLVAYLTGISEVNPLPAYYRCKNEKCRYLEFIDTELAGIDMQNKKCPDCGENMLKEGFNIPFETFLDVGGKKVPDIDLNFSGDYQARIHKFVYDLFGNEKVFRAGTISGIMQKAAKKDLLVKYFEKMRKTPKKAEIERLVLGCLDVKRSTGQHPGGLILVPKEKDIYDFTPIQMSPNRDAITTHFDFHHIHNTLVKIDALGHDIPTSIKKICPAIGLKVEDIPLDDKETMKIFSDISTLGVDAKNYDFPVGTVGIPEFGTTFTRSMLAKTKPKTMSELVYIMGLSHGENVWTGNAEELITKKTATLSEVIAVRDDIMNFLRHKGMEKTKAFGIMEHVRKGEGLTPEEEKIMRSCEVPDWYIESCKKIKYMFPKAHAVAYTMMSLRLAYVKVHHAPYFYADYFDRKLKIFDYDFSFLTIKELKAKMRELFYKKDRTKKEEDQVDVLEVIMEMKERGIQLLNVDIYESDSLLFTVKGNILRMPLAIVPLLGEKVASNFLKERAKGPFKSMEEMVKRTKINKTVLQFFKSNKIGDDIPDTNQTMLF